MRAIPITKNCDMGKTRDVSHCVSSLLQKLVMLVPTKKSVKFLEELRMPSLLGYKYVQLHCIQNSDTAARTFNAGKGRSDAEVL